MNISVPIYSPMVSTLKCEAKVAHSIHTSHRVYYVDRKHVLIDGLGRCLIYEYLDLAPVEQHDLQMNDRLSLFTFVSAQGRSYLEA